MQGFDTLWLPGMDHAAIATEAKVVARVNIGDYGKGEFGNKKHEHTFLELVQELDKVDNIVNSNFRYLFVVNYVFISIRITDVVSRIFGNDISMLCALL